MFSVAEPTTETNLTLCNLTERKADNKINTVVICGACGAQENLVGENKTECPHCDEYIY